MKLDLMDNICFVNSLDARESPEYALIINHFDFNLKLLHQS